MLAVLANATESFTATLLGVPATTPPNYSLTWIGTGGNYPPTGPNINVVGALNNSTVLKTLLVGDTSPKQIKSIQIYNADSAACTVALKVVNADGTFTLLNVTIPVAATLNWIDGQVPTVTNNYGTTPSDAIGAIVAGIGVTVAESGFGNFRRTILTLTNTPLSLTDALAYTSLKLYDFTAGRYRFFDCVASLAFTTTSTIASTLKSGVTCSWGIGTVAASSITLATTMMNLMPGSGETVKAFTSSTVINVAGTTVTGFLANIAAAQLAACINGTATDPDLYLNISVPTITDIDADAGLTVSGTIQLSYVNGGDV